MGYIITYVKQDNVHTNTESVQCISIVYSICPYKYNQRKPPYRRKNLARISYASRVIAHFVANFVAMATGVGRGKMQLAAFDGPSPKTPLQSQKSRKNLLRKPSYSPFCPKFCCHGNGDRSGENAIYISFPLSFPFP